MAAGATTSQTAIVVCDDHPVVRTGLRMLLQSQPDMKVIAETCDLAAALAVTRARHPDVLLLDLHMDGGTTVDAIPDLRATAPRTAIVVLTMEKDVTFALAALRAGALGYVLKESAESELLDAVRLARERRTYLNPELGAKLARGGVDSRAADDTLTEREREVLRLIALGHTNPEMASSLGVSVRTIESHRAHIQEKLHRHTRAQLVSYALEVGLLDPSR